MSGTAIRLERILDRTTGKAFIVPLDHGATMGPMPGLFDIRDTVAKVADGGATAVLMHKGLIDTGHRKCGRDLGLIVHLSAGSIYSSDPGRKVLVTSVEEALRRGADAVSIHLNIGGESEAAMLEEAGAVSDACNAWGVPLLAMVYPRGSAAEQPESVRTCVRVAAELGADIVKTAYTGSVESFREVTKGCPIPVLIAGGPQMGSDRAFLTMVSDAMKAGAGGVSIGRGIFGHPDIVGMCSAVSDIVFRNADVDTALARIRA
ncbi:MAG TPA: 2-amino-3,7-dideoxy-D-threo-hept-6-ulosonate synthase [Methanocorpusculum sp.]|nr:2-amino-3,7-dideoxy-D-threo-hept-6-ulosonate synthase [Methanocorpusculum sp.]